MRYWIIKTRRTRRKKWLWGLASYEEQVVHKTLIGSKTYLPDAKWIYSEIGSYFPGWNLEILEIEEISPERAQQLRGGASW